MAARIADLALILQKLAQMKAGFHKIKAGCAHYDIALIDALSSAIKLYAFGQFSIKEITGFTLYVPEIRRSMPVLISKERSLAKLARMNPRTCQDQTENKANFYKICRAANLPLPEYYGIFRNGRGTDADGNPLEGRADWIAYFKARLPAHFIIKDLNGAYASGFSAFDRHGDRFTIAEGEDFDAAGLYDELCRRTPSELIFQERLFDHPDLEALSGRPGLQTIRINTIMDDDGEISVLFYWLKIRVGDNIADNFSMGTTGNLAGFGALQEGVLKGARACHPCGSGLTTVYSHPETGISIAGYRIPLWKQAVELAKLAHGVFASFGSLGWDIALTPDGPQLIEANAWWDPPLFVPTVMSDDDWHRIFD